MFEVSWCHESCQRVNFLYTVLVDSGRKGRRNCYKHRKCNKMIHHDSFLIHCKSQSMYMLISKGDRAGCSVRDRPADQRVNARSRSHCELHDHVACRPSCANTRLCISKLARPRRDRLQPARGTRSRVSWCHTTRTEASPLSLQFRFDSSVSNKM